MSAPARVDDVGRATRTMAVASAISRVTGFLRTIVLAAALGFGLVADAYFTANVLPNIVYELLLGGVLTSVIVPLLVHAQTEHADGGAAYTQRLLTLLTVVLTLATVAAVLAAPLLTYAYGIRDDAAQVSLATMLARILLVEIVFYGLGAMLAAVLNSRGVFGPPAWAPVLNNVVVIATGLLFIAARGPGQLTPVTITAAEVWLVGVGTTLGIVVQAAVLFPSMRRAGLAWRWRFDWRHTGLAEAGRLSLWVLGYVAVSQLGYLVITALANAAGRESGIGSAVYGNASLLFQMPYGIIGVALLTALLPRMSRAAARADIPAVLDDLSLGTRITAVALLPITAALVVLGPAIATVAFAHGRVDPDQARAVGTVLAASAFGLLPFAVTMLQLRVFYAMKDARTPTLVNLVMVAVRIPLCLLCPVLLEPRHVVVGLAVANSVSFVVGAVLGELWLRRRLGAGDRTRVRRTLTRLSVASVAGGLVAWVVVAAVYDALGRGVVGSAVALLAGSLIGGAVALAATLVLRVAEVTSLLGALRRRSTGTAGAVPVTGRAVTDPRTDPQTDPRTAPRTDTETDPRTDEGTDQVEARPVTDPTSTTTIGGRYHLLVRSGADQDTETGRLSTWRARDTLLERDVLLRVHSPGGPDARAFLDRALAAGVLSHPTLAMVYDAVDENRRAFVVSEWVEGTSLAAVLRQGPLEVTEARETVRRLAEGVATAHRRGIALGGLLPERIQMTDNGSVTVTAIPAPQASIDGDVRALGAVLFAALTGDWPAGTEAGDLRDRLGPNLPADLVQVVLDALTADPAPAARDIVDALLAGRGAFSQSGLGYVGGDDDSDPGLDLFGAVEPDDGELDDGELDGGGSGAGRARTAGVEPDRGLGRGLGRAVPSDAVVGPAAGPPRPRARRRLVRCLGGGHRFGCGNADRLLRRTGLVRRTGPIRRAGVRAGPPPAAGHQSGGLPGRADRPGRDVRGGIGIGIGHHRHRSDPEPGRAAGTGRGGGAGRGGRGPAPRRAAAGHRSQ